MLKNEALIDNSKLMSQRKKQCQVRTLNHKKGELDQHED